MRKRKYINSSVRFYEDRPGHSQAYDILMNRNRDIFKSQDDFIAEAIIHYHKHLHQEMMQEKVQEITDFIDSNFLYDKIKDLIRSEIPDIFRDELKKITEVTGNVASVELPDDKADSALDADKDKQFAAFYSFED